MPDICRDVISSPQLSFHLQRFKLFLFVKEIDYDFLLACINRIIYKISHCIPTVVFYWRFIDDIVRGSKPQHFGKMLLFLIWFVKIINLLFNFFWWKDIIIEEFARWDTIVLSIFFVVDGITWIFQNGFPIYTVFVNVKELLFKYDCFPLINFFLYWKLQTQFHQVFLNCILFFF